MEVLFIVRIRTATLTAAIGTTLSAPATLYAPATLPVVAHMPGLRPEAAEIRAADLLAKLGGCAPVSHGRYRSDRGAPATIPVCGKNGAVFWKADLDIDCDGRPGSTCNARTDPWFMPTTAFPQSDGRYPSSERLPYVVVPGASGIWNYRQHGIRGGSVAALIYRGKVRYAVVGDTGPTDIIGEASYAAAKSLGIPANPRSGGAASGVTYLVFKNSKATPIESPRAAVTEGKRLARQFLRRH